MWDSCGQVNIWSTTRRDRKPLRTLLNSTRYSAITIGDFFLPLWCVQYLISTCPRLVAVSSGMAPRSHPITSLHLVALAYQFEIASFAISPAPNGSLVRPFLKVKTSKNTSFGILHEVFVKYSLSKITSYFRFINPSSLQYFSFWNRWALSPDELPTLREPRGVRWILPRLCSNSIWCWEGKASQEMLIRLRWNYAGCVWMIQGMSIM